MLCTRKWTSPLQNTQSTDHKVISIVETLNALNAKFNLYTIQIREFS